MFLTFSATLKVKSGLSTLNNISGNKFNNTLVKPRKVISFKSKIELIPNFFKYVPPTDKY